MPGTTESGTTATARSKAIKRANALTSILSGGVPAVILGLLFPSDSETYGLGFLVGLLWANGFEYVYHRFLLHRPRSSLARHHLQHHAVTGTSAEAEQVNFGESPFWVMLLFAANGALIVAADLLLGLGIAPGVLIAFSVYYVVLEEIHWRVHLGGWLPPGLRSAKAYHLAHHDRPDARFNVFLPIFDWLLGTSGHSHLLSYPASRPLH